MYLAKYFHRSAGEADQRVLLCKDGGVLCTIRGRLVKGEEHASRENFKTVSDLVRGFRSQVATLKADGYFETIQVDYKLSKLPGNPEPKPDWQMGVDEMYLCVLVADLAAAEGWLRKLKVTPAQNEPLFLYLASRVENDVERAREIYDACIAARESLMQHLAGGTPFYCWSLPPYDVDADIHTWLCEVQLVLNQPQNALASIERACKMSLDSYRAGRKAFIQCTHFPELREDAFDHAYRYAKFGGFEKVTALPAYEEYLRGRQASAYKSRWGASRAAAKEQAVCAAEAEFQIRLPQEYRTFLLTRAHGDLILRTPDSTGTLHFIKAENLCSARAQFAKHLGPRSGEDGTEHVRSQYGLDLERLVPIAHVHGASNYLVLHIGAGERFGFCYRWYHDDLWEFVHAGDNFDAALESIIENFKTGDAKILDFLGLPA
jgi:hypothetical protein